MLLSTIVEQSDLLAEALAAEVKVQVDEDRLVKSDTRDAAGAAVAKPAAMLANSR